MEKMTKNKYKSDAFTHSYQKKFVSESHYNILSLPLKSMGEIGILVCTMHNLAELELPMQHHVEKLKPG